MTNLMVGVASFAVFIFVVLGAARMGKAYLFGLSIAFILMSNITVQMNVEIAPGIVISWAIIIYSLVYLITDFVIEFYGRNEAFKLAAANLAVQYILWIYVWLSLMVSPASTGSSPAVYATMSTLFGTTTQITLAASIGALGPFSDILITGRLRTYLKTRRLFRHEILNLIARTKLSTLLGELVNTVFFFCIALIGTGVTTQALVSIIVSAILVKWATAVLDAPFLYAFFRYSGPPPDASEGDLQAQRG